MNFDFIVVGSGPVGIAVTRKIAKTGVKVAFILGENRFYRRTLIELNSNVHSSHENIDSTRWLGRGGTSNLWGGRLVNLDPVDFLNREALHLPNWPFSYSEYTKCVNEAYEFFGIDVNRIPKFESPLKDGSLSFGSYEIWTPNRSMFKFYKHELMKYPNLKIFNKEILTRIDLGEKDIEIQLSTQPGEGTRLRGKRLVLCCGTIENNRIIMNLDQRYPELTQNGLRPGENYTTHLMIHLNSVRIPSSYWRAKRINGIRIRPRVRVSEKEQELHGILNAAGFFAQNSGGGMKSLVKNPFSAVPRLVRSHGTDLPKYLWNYRKSILSSKASSEVPLKEVFHLQTEMAPNLKSKFTLLDKQDGWGNFLVQPNLEIAEIDSETVRKSAKIIVENLGLEVNHRHFEEEIDSELENVRLNPQSHHQLGGLIIGTSREKSVTNEFGVLHNYPNLYCLGGSMFPTSGQANSTMPMVTLALRSAEQMISS